MKFALDNKGRRVRADKNGRALCPCCQSRVIAKVGRIVIPHWAHESVKDCDSWSEGETAWHTGWKEKFPEDWCEVVMGPHRADVRRDDGAVIELQHSPISVDEIAEREQFYGSMVWLFDGTEFYSRIAEADLYNGHILFSWKNTRPSYLTCRKPLFFDVGYDRILFVEKLLHGGGVGKMLRAEEFVRLDLNALKNLFSNLSLESFLDCVCNTPVAIAPVWTFVVCPSVRSVRSTIDRFIESRYGTVTLALREHWCRGGSGPFSYIVDDGLPGLVCPGRPILQFGSFESAVHRLRCQSDSLSDGSICVLDGDGVVVVKTL